MTNEELYQQRLDRILDAVALQRPDRVPVMLEYSGFAACVTKTPMADFLRSPDRNVETMIEAFRLVGDGDGVNYGSFWPYGLCYDYMAKVRVPGVDLPDNEMWQVVESEVMQRADYDRLLEIGWPAFSDRFMRTRILNDVPADYLPPRRAFLDPRPAWRAAGVPVLSGGDVTTPFELLCGARSLPRFAADLIEIPDTVEAAMHTIAPHLAASSIRRAVKHGYPAVWIGGWQTAPCLLSPAMWNRFVWPYFKMLVEEVVEGGLIALLHLDSDWTRELERFRELPAGRCIMALDGATDIVRAKRIVGSRMCITGDVPAAMLYLQQPGDVRAYCRQLIRKIGPTGFILQSGCDIPANARLENVRAMVDAAAST
jgi:hypothetical protein